MKLPEKMYQLAIFFCISFISLVEAKTLYIDLNHTEKEIAIFKGDAASEGDFILLPKPERSDYFLDQGKKIALLKDRLERLQEIQIKKFGCRDTGQYRGPHKVLNCLAANPNYTSVSGEIAEIDRDLDKLNRYHARDLREDLLEVWRQMKDLPTDQQIDRLVISGHQDKTDFYGDMAWMSDAELTATLESFSGSLLKNVKSVFLLGCKTIQEDLVLKYWGKAFPNVFQFAGYEQTGYLSDSAQGNRMLKELVQKQRIHFSAALSGDEKAKQALLSDDPRSAASFVVQRDQDTQYEFYRGKRQVRKFLRAQKQSEMSDSSSGAN